MPDARELRIINHTCERVWLIEYPVRFAAMDLTARTTLIRLQSGRLFVHSPCPWSDGLRAQLAGLGTVAFVIAPGNYHTLHGAAWRDAYPEAELWVCPGSERKFASSARLQVLTDEPAPGWRGEIDQVVMRGSRWMREVVFFDRPSRTLIVTDLIENYGDASARVPRMLRIWWHLFGTWNRPRPAPEYQLGWRDKAAARASMTRVLSWDFERIVLAHGELIEHDARAVAQQAWRAVLGP